MKNDLTGRVSVTINAPAERVWEALTTPSIIKKYFFNTDAISGWKVGSPLVFRGEWDGKQYEDKGHIIEMVKNKLFRYSYWSSMSGAEDKPENYVTISYELSEKDSNTLLTVTQENIPDEKMKKHSEENWKKVFGDLKKLLEKRPVQRGNVHA